MGLRISILRCHLRIGTEQLLQASWLAEKSRKQRVLYQGGYHLPRFHHSVRRNDEIRRIRTCPVFHRCIHRMVLLLLGRQEDECGPWDGYNAFKCSFYLRCICRHRDLRSNKWWQQEIVLRCLPRAHHRHPYDVPSPLACGPHEPVTGSCRSMDWWYHWHHRSCRCRRHPHRGPGCRADRDYREIFAERASRTRSILHFNDVGIPWN